MDQQVVTVDQFTAAMASIQEALASLRQEISGQQGRPPVARDDVQYDHTVPPPPPPSQSAPQAMSFTLHSQTEVALPPVTVPTPTSEDPHARMDRLEQGLRQLRTSDRAITWEGFDGVPVASLPAKFRMPDIERYTGIGCPRLHLRLYSTVMRAHGLDEPQMITLFPLSLSGAAQRWFTSLEASRHRTWDDLAQEFLRQFSFNTVVDVSRRELEALRQRTEEFVSSFISRWRGKIAEIIDRPSERDQIQMVLRSLQPRIARHVVGAPFTDFGSLVMALYDVEDGISRGLWTDSSPSDVKGKKPFVGQRSTDYRPRAPRPAYDQTYTPQTLALPYYASQGIERPPVSYTATGQPCYAAQFTARPAAPYPRPRAQQTSAPFALRAQRQFSQIGMPLSQALRKLTEAGLLTTLTPRPPPQPIPPQFRMDLHCAYHQGPGHETDRCTALRHAIQDLIDQGLVHLGQPSVTTNPLPAHITHAVPPPADGIHFLEFDVIDDHIHMLSDDDSDLEPIMPDVIYETSGVTLGPWMPAPFGLVPEAASVQAATVEPLILPHYSVWTPFILIPDVEGVQTPYVDDSQTLDIQYVLRGGRVMRQPPPAAAARPLGGTSSQEEVREEDDEILRQLQSTQARISIWSLLASSSTHRDALTRALSQIRVDTTTTPEGLIHMMTAGRATCIVFSDNDLPPEGSGHTRPLYISVGCSGRRVPSVLLDNGSALNVCPLAIAIALGYAPSDFGPSTQTVRAYDSTRREVMGTLEIELLIGPTTFITVFQVLRIPTSFNLLLGRPWIHRAGAIPSSLHQKVKFIHEGQVVVVQSAGDMFISTEPVLQISHSDDDLLLTGFTFDEVQTLELEDFCRDFVAMSFDQHSSTVVLDIMRSMSYLPGMGLGRRQHGPSEFITIPDHDGENEGSTDSYAVLLSCSPIHQESGRLLCEGIEAACIIRWIIRGLSTTQEAELQHLVQQLRLRDGAPGPSTSALIAPSSPDRTSLMTLCFPDETDEHGTFAEVGGIVDGAAPHDVYIDEMLTLSLSQIEETIQPGLASSFDLFGVFVIELAEESLTAPALESAEDLIAFDDLMDGHVGIVEGASDFVDPPLSFDVLSGFVSRSDVVFDDSSMDLSMFEYFPASRDIALLVPSSPTSQIFDIDDDIAKHDSDDDSPPDSDSDPVDQRVSPAVGDTKIVDFGTADQPRELRIGSDLSTDERDSLIQLLRSYLDVFAWSYEDMSGLDPSIVQHRLPLLPHARPVKQKLRRLHPRWSLQVKEEIQKQLSVGFLSVVEYPEWLANVVPVPKKDSKVRVCVDFRDLNKASPKDDFPFPHIDMLVDSTAGHPMLSFMDGFSGYSQILMAPEDMEKTSFIIEWGTYCYRVMPFGLKNAGATYQRAATTLFHDMIHRDVEVYVDDMIVKSRDRSDHLAALERIRQFRLRLNPKKCTFEVTSGKLLGYMVSERGIEVDPDKIRAILEMPAPRTEREVKGFLGRLQYIMPACLREDQRVFVIPPVLAPPTPGRPLLLYLSVSDVALGCMLAQLDDSGKDRAIYYLSKRMLDYETRYVMIERYCLALVWATRRLRHYMTEYSVHLISRLDPLRYLFDRPALGSIVADHLASLPVYDARVIDNDFPDEDVAAVTSLSGWRMYFDGAANHSGYGIGVLLISPHGDHIPRSVRLAFSDRHPATNNIVEYEACILGLETALELGIRQMEVFGDSNLVLRQIQGEWKTRDVKLKPYHAYLELLVGRFDDLRYTHLPRAQNQFTDALATLASMIDIPVDATVQPLLIESRSAPAYCCLIDDVEPDDGLPWYHDIYHFLRLGVYPEAATAKDKRALRQLATRFVICGETLYRRSPDGMLLLCLDRASADRVMRRFMRESADHIWQDICWPVRS
ncbi:Retrovirus-related Pol polyprotein from transposon 17.6 [Vitis vinifera]|uniref:RNA-directed DNA polymerase n=1 Tax=Vitis vinifera TaxID=29760 RepID=A0A438H0I8_VITVI|nr:Retrovirus-related Pol polyprotein from transposon 17.6 [Vitis vinifera]